MKTIDEKKAYEEKFKVWAKGTEYEGVVEQLDSLQLILNKYTYANENYSEAIAAIEWPAYARRERKDSASFFKDYYQPIDEQCFVQLLTAYGENVTGELRAPYYDQKLAQYGSIEAWKDAVFASEAEAKEFGDAFYNFALFRRPAHVSALPRLNLLFRLERCWRLDLPALHVLGAL
jgi:hypothetical protein